jgi:CHAT domain-containing protein
MARKRHLLLNGLQIVLVWHRIFYTALFIISLLICLLGNGMIQSMQAKSTQCNVTEIGKFRGKNGHRERELLEACKGNKDLLPQERAKILQRLAIVSYDGIGSLAYDQLSRGDRKGKLDRVESLLKESIDLGEKLLDQSIVNDARYTWAQISANEIERLNFGNLEKKSPKDTVTFYQQLQATIALLRETEKHPTQSPIYDFQPKLGEARLLINHLPAFYEVLQAQISELETNRLDEIQKKLDNQANDSGRSKLLSINLNPPKPPELIELENITLEITRELFDILQKTDTTFPTLEPNQTSLALYIYHSTSLKKLNLVMKAMAAFETKRQEIFNTQQSEFQAQNNIKSISSRPTNIPANTPKQPVYISFWSKQLRETAQNYYKIAPQRAAELLTRSISIARTIQTSNQPTLTSETRTALKREELQAINALATLYEENQQFAAAATLISDQILMEADALGSPEISGLLYGRAARLRLAQIKKKQQSSPEDTKAALALSNTGIQRIELVRGDLLSLSPDLQYNYRDSVEPLYRENIELQLLQPEPNLKIILDRLESLKLAEIHNYFREPCIENKVNLDQLINQNFQNTALIYTVLLGDRLEIIAKLPDGQQTTNSNGGLRHYRTEQKRLNIEAAANNLNKKILKGAVAPPSESQDLYNWIFGAQQVGTNQRLDKALEPLMRSKGSSTLIMVLDGALRKIPIAALHDGKSYLLDNFAIAISPGLQLFEPKQISQPKILFAGQTEFDAFKLQSLKGSGVELKNLQKRIPPQGILSDAAGQKYKFLTLSSFSDLVAKEPFNVVHLATHAKFSSNQENTYIVMGNQKVGTEQFSEILSRRDRTRTEAIDLLILSACETAAGDDRAALGLSGLAIRSGARSTLASLWPIADETDVTPTLLDDFYQNLFKNGQNKAQSLRQSQLNLKRNGKPISKWAPFVIVGNWL